MMQDAYIRRAKLVRVIDGDTCEVEIDLGFLLTKRERVRVLGVNCPEMKGATKAAGQAAKEFAVQWFADRSAEFVVRTVKDKEDSFGRFLAEIVSGDDSLGADLLAHGHAVVFRGAET